MILQIFLSGCFFLILAVIFLILFLHELKTAQLNKKSTKILFEQAGKAVFYYDLKKNQILPSGSLERVFGKQIAAAFNFYKDFHKVVYQSDLPIVEQAELSVRNGTDVKDIKFRLKSEESQTVWCSLNSVTLRKDRKRYLVIGSLGNIDKQVRDEEVLRFKAECDQMTGLYNKITTETLITNILQDRKYKNVKNAMLMIDIDNLKNINDRLGHIFGDMIIGRLADCIKMTFRESDILGRVGGDEFVIFMKDCTSEEAVRGKAEQLCSTYRTTLENAGSKVPVSCSIGIAVYPDNGDSFLSLYSNADKALYDAKKSGKNSCVLFLPLSSKSE